MVVAESSLSEGHNRRCLDAFRHGEAGEQLPPTFQVRNQSLRVRTRFGKRSFAAAQFLGQHALLIPAQNVGRGSLVPVFDEGAEYIIMVGIP